MDRRFYGLLKNDAVRPILDRGNDRFHSTKSGKLRDWKGVLLDVLLVRNDNSCLPCARCPAAPLLPSAPIPPARVLSHSGTPA